MSANSHTITVWGRRNSMNVQKVMWTLGELGLDYQRHDVGGSFGVDDQYKAKNPNAVVPTIEDGELTLYESNACVRYLARQYGTGPVDGLAVQYIRRRVLYDLYEQNSSAC
jgi:glutathione S-transferase